jgi:uncharacterized membrane protein (DUF106 family)
MMAIIEILQQNALLSIIGISAALAFGSTLVYKYATDQGLMKSLREEIKRLQNEMKLHKTEPQKLAEIQSKLMPLNMRMMSQSMKPMLLTIVPFIIIFALLGKVYNNMIVIPLFFWAGHLKWVGTYIIFSVILTTVFRKALKVA